MKILLISTLVFLSRNAFAASVCMVVGYGDPMTIQVTCDGRSKVTGSSYDGATVAIKDLLDKGYKLVNSSSKDGQLVFTLIHD